MPQRAGATMELVESVETPDDFTVVVNLTAADATFMVNTATTLIYPAKYHAEVGEEAYSGAPIGTGAFKLDGGGEWIPAQRTVLVANEDYFRGRPNFDQFQIDIVPEANGRWAALDTGTADNSIWSLNAEDNTRWSMSGNFTVYQTLNNAVNHFVLNNEKPPWPISQCARRSDPRHRPPGIHRRCLPRPGRDGDQQSLAERREVLQPGRAHSTNTIRRSAKTLLDEAGWVAGDDGIREKDGTQARLHPGHHPGRYPAPAGSRDRPAVVQGHRRRDGALRKSPTQLPA